ncbi:heavy metal-associated isoprenylated plant protein 19-like [Lotus japonicus]|uniref:heavy metal-associated isoprenylated plant protein 19-like n=1 Tax=Lotus japonicus TaxID=34305 RepID=UPI0025893D74|nr:heavy metal-associated isoprenylated plant protein 19-like [Lotus japonicus]
MRGCKCYGSFNSTRKDEECEPNKLTVVEFKVSMHCEGCETKVSKALSKFKGVEEFTIDREKHQVVVTGRFDLEKLLKKLKKTTKMTVEIVSEKDEEESSDESDDESDDELLVMQQFEPEYYPNCMRNETLMMFSDENPNACVIM